MEDIDREEIARLIREGYASGRLDLGDNSGKHISWELNIEEWED